MTKPRRHFDFMDDKQTTELMERFENKKRGKNARLKGINFLQSILNIRDKDILKQLDGIPLFKTYSNIVKVYYLIVITYIAFKLRADFLSQRYLNLIAPK